MEEIRLQSYKTAAEVAQKFDYWVATLVGAVLAYSIQHFSPQKYNSTLSLVEPYALLLLVVSFWFSYKRLESAFLSASLGYDLVNDQYLISRAQEALAKNPRGAEELTKGFRTADQVNAEIEQRRANIEKTEKQLERQNRVSSQSYRYRFVFLTAGLVALLVAKMIEPYLHP